MNKIYFAASIRGGQDDRQLYAKLIEELGKYGEILTEHIVGNSTTHMGSPGKVEDIYKQDMDWLSKSTVMIAEVTQPSLGVGYEIAYAEMKKIPVLCLYRPSENKSLSAMIAGSPHTKLVNYQSFEEAKQAIKDFFNNVI